MSTANTAAEVAATHQFLGLRVCAEEGLFQDVQIDRAVLNRGRYEREAKVDEDLRTAGSVSP
jgi:hypothetical protein